MVRTSASSLKPASKQVYHGCNRFCTTKPLISSFSMREYPSPTPGPPLFRLQLKGLAVHTIKLSEVKNYPSLADIPDGFALQAGNMVEAQGRMDAEGEKRVEDGRWRGCPWDYL